MLVLRGILVRWGAACINRLTNSFKRMEEGDYGSRRRAGTLAQLKNGLGRLASGVSFGHRTGDIWRGFPEVPR